MLENLVGASIPLCTNITMMLNDYAYATFAFAKAEMERLIAA